MASLRRLEERVEKQRVGFRTFPGPRILISPNPVGSALRLLRDWQVVSVPQFPPREARTAMFPQPAIADLRSRA